MCACLREKEKESLENQIETFSFLFFIFTNLSARAGYDTRSIFKQSLTGLNSEFSILTSYLTKAEEPTIYPLLEG